MARISVLIEDLTLELEYLKKVDRDSPEFVYFLRRSVATLHEFGEALIELDGNPEFTETKLQFEPDMQDAWNDSIAYLQTYTGKKGQKKVVTSIRDDIGGHFGQDAARKAVINLQDGPGSIEFAREGFILHFSKHIAISTLTSHSGGAEFANWYPEFSDVLSDGFRHCREAAYLVSYCYLWPLFKDPSHVPLQAR